MSYSRRLSAIMFTDIVGYSAIMQRNEQQAVGSAKRHQDVLETCTAQHEGEVLNYYGDGSLTVFPSASEAVRCSIDMQRKFQQDPALPLRIGIHIGEIHFDKAKIFGDSVNIASRLEGLGVAGSVIVSEKVTI